MQIINLIIDGWEFEQMFETSWTFYYFTPIKENFSFMVFDNQYKPNNNCLPHQHFTTFNED